jgi:hypothetical protein
MEYRLIEEARNFSKQSPNNFADREAKYKKYLSDYPQGAFVTEAREALSRIELECDKFDFRLVRDVYVARAIDTDNLRKQCLRYKSVHPTGRYVKNVDDLLRWVERITTNHEYTVNITSGIFDTKIAHFFSRGPDLAVEIEVAGRRYGPSPVIANRYDPDWLYQIPRGVQWKKGDQVKIRVIDYDWKQRVVLEYVSAEGDQLAIRMLCGDNTQGKNTVKLGCSYSEPILPKIE